MSTDIFYFSGTGNSLFVARQFGELLTNQVRILPIESCKDNKKVGIESDSMLIVCPVYFQTLPDIVKSFLRKLEFEFPVKIYGVVTCNGGPGHSLFAMDKILNKKGQSLQAGFTITMPGNSLIIRDFTNPEDVRKLRLGESHHKIKEIYEHIENKRPRRIEGNNGFMFYLKGIFTMVIAKYIYKTPSEFKTTKACTKCGACVRICPSENIRIGRQGIIWGNSCEQCLACLHWCPNTAIEIGNTTSGKLRYHHPDIKINDMYRRS